MIKAIAVIPFLLVLAVAQPALASEVTGTLSTGISATVGSGLVGIVISPSSTTNNGSSGGGGGGGGNAGGGGTAATDIAVTKSVSDAAPHEGDIIYYTLTASLSGSPAIPGSVSVQDTLPSGLTFLFATSSRGTYSSSTGIWNIGVFATSTQATLVVAAAVNNGTAGTSITNQAAIVAANSFIDQNPGNNTASVQIKVGTSTVSTAAIATATTAAAMKGGTTATGIAPLAINASTKHKLSSTASETVGISATATAITTAIVTTQPIEEPPMGTSTTLLAAIGNIMTLGIGNMEVAMAFGLIALFVLVAGLRIAKRKK